MKSDNRTLSIYLAARFDRKHQLRRFASLLESHGATITSRWLRTHDHPEPGESLADAQTRFALEDEADIKASDMVICFTESEREYNSGGRHVEFGMARALGKVLVVIGPRENVFHALPDVVSHTDVTWMVENITRYIQFIRGNPERA